MHSVTYREKQSHTFWHGCCIVNGWQDVLEVHTLFSKLSSLGLNLGPDINCHPGVSQSGGIHQCVCHPSDGRSMGVPSASISSWTAAIQWCPLRRVCELSPVPGTTAKLQIPAITYFVRVATHPGLQPLLNKLLWQHRRFVQSIVHYLICCLITW